MIKSTVTELKTASWHRINKSYIYNLHITAGLHIKEHTALQKSTETKCVVNQELTVTELVIV